LRDFRFNPLRGDRLSIKQAGRPFDGSVRPRYTKGKRKAMELEYTYWKSKDGWIVGYLNIWPDHVTQGKTIAELEEMLLDLYEFYKEEQEAAAVEKKTGMVKIPV
jgi:predicted RNase H-like HicB family nuclease